MNRSSRKLSRDTSIEKKLELLFEIGCEEIPAGMLARAEDELKVNLEKLLATENLIENITVETFSGPRRLRLENLRIVSRPPMLQSAALDAVRT